MRFLLAIDGGGTGCRAALADVAGVVLGAGAAGPANIATDLDLSLGNVLGATRAALAAAGLGEGVLDETSVVLGLAGANLGLAAQAFAARLPFAHARLVSDAVTAAAGALRGADGIVAAMGTGSVYVRLRRGAMRQIGGHGFRLGDHGGGAVLGRSLLVEALRAADGLRLMTPLLQAALDEVGGVEGIIAFGLHAQPVEYARFAPRIVTGADPAGAVIFDAAVAEAAATLDHLQEGGAPLPVVFLGGLGAAYAARLASRFQIRAPLGSGLDGALWLAGQEEGA